MPPLPALGLGVHGGAFDASDARDAEPLGGVHGRLRLLPFLGIEGSVDVRQADFEVEGRSLQEIDLDGWQVRAGLTYYLR